MERAHDFLRRLRWAAAALAVLLVVSCMATHAQEQPKKPAGGEKPPVETPEPGKQKQPGGDEKKAANTGKQEGVQDDTAENGEKEEKKEDKKDKDKPLKFTKEQIERAYPVGERLTYNVSWSGIHAGTSVLEVKDKVRYKGRECFRIRASTDSAKVISLLYKVENRAQTYVDAETLEPLRSDVKQREGSRRREQYIIYTPAQRTARYYKKKERKFVLRREHTDMPYGIQGTLSSIYFLRAMKLELGKTYKVTILGGRRMGTGVFDVTKKKEIKIRGVGTFTGLRITPRYVEVPGKEKMRPGEGLFNAESEPEIWLDEATGMPLIMVVNVPVGSVRVQLIKKEMIEKKK